MTLLLCSSGNLNELKGRQEATEHEAGCGGRYGNLSQIWVLQVSLQAALTLS